MTQLNAVDEAIKGISGIPFTEFTSSLIDGVFETLVDSQLTQTDAFVEMLEAVSKGLASYINDTQDDVDDEQTLAFLQNLPEMTQAPGPTGLTPLDKVSTAMDSSDGGAVVKIASSVIETIRDRVSIPGVTNDLPSASADNEVEVDVLRAAVAKRISANRFTVLETMVKQGMARIVVDYGQIETRLTFSSFERHTDDRKLKDRDKDKAVSRSKSRSNNGFLGRILGKRKHKNVERSKTVHVKQLKEHNRDVSGSSVKFYSRVMLQFKTDYMPLDG